MRWLRFRTPHRAIHSFSISCRGSSVPRPSHVNIRDKWTAQPPSEQRADFATPSTQSLEPPLPRHHAEHEPIVCRPVHIGDIGLDSLPCCSGAEITFAQV